MLSSILAGIAAQALLCTVQAQQVRTDPGTAGPPLEIVHLYEGQWPTGVAVSSSGRLFSSFPAGLDTNNTNTGSGAGASKFQVAELFNGTERAYPSLAMNSPPGGAINRTTTPQPTGANLTDYLISVQSVVVDSLDRLWLLDTGRPADPESGMLLDNTGGCKLVGVNLSNNTVFRTITFPPTVCYRDSYFNDVRFALNGNDSMGGFAFITDSSSEGRNGIVTIDLSTGQSWRHLNNDPRTHAEMQFVPFVWGQPVYGFMAGQPASFLGFGADGIALSSDSSELYFAPTGGSFLFSIPTAALKRQGPFSELRAQAAVTSLTQKGASDGFETDTNGFIYMGNAEQEAVIFWNPANATVSTFVRDPRINWIDTLSVGTDGYLYFTVNQLNFSPQSWPGTDRRVHPYVLFRAKLPNGGKKVV